MISELEIQDIVKQFGTNLVIDGISFQVQEGEFLVLLGPSGGGKSTLLRIICGLERPDKGRILLNNQDITELTPQQRNVGMVFQDYGLYPHMNVYKNIAYGLQMHGVKKAEIKQRIHYAAEILGITSLIKRSTNDLSGGEQQRVALAKIMVRDADLYLYDEPFSSLDPKLRHQLRSEILKVHRSKQRPSIYVTHDQVEAFAMADRIAVVANKRLQQVGTVENLLHSPTNVFVAQFLGTPPTNILQAQLAILQGHYHAQYQNIAIPLPIRWNRFFKRSSYTDILLGIRPEAIVPEWLFQHTAGTPLIILSARVLSIETLYAEAVMNVKLLHLQSPQTDQEISEHLLQTPAPTHTADRMTINPTRSSDAVRGTATIITSTFQQSNHPLPHVGEIIRLGIYDQHLNLFDPTTEQAIKIWFD